MPAKPSNNLNAQLKLAFDKNLFVPGEISPLESFNKPISTGAAAATPEPEMSSLPTPPQKPEEDDPVFNLASDSSMEDILAFSDGPIEISHAPPNKRKTLSNDPTEPEVVHEDLQEVDIKNHDTKSSAVPEVVDLSAPPRMIDSSPAAPTDHGRFRLSQAPQSQVSDLPKPEIGALFTEKIALLEQLVSQLKHQLARNGIQFSSKDLNAKLRDVDQRIDNFTEDQDETKHIVEVFSSPPRSQGPPPHTNESIFDDFESPEESELEEIGFVSNVLPSMESDFEELNISASRSPYFEKQIHVQPPQMPPSQMNPSQLQPSQMPRHTQPTQPMTQITQHPWTRDVMHALKTKFGLQSFRSNQMEAINETLAGRDVAVLMPTGGGKSLCYQLPALVSSGKTRGTTIVISPLISLMEDQVYHLKNRSIQAEALSSRLDPGTRTQVLAEFARGDLQLLYASPEMLSASGAMKSMMERLYSNNQLARIVIDEAHCVSSWGHDFRPDYLELSKVRYSFPNTPIMALTATANERVLLDIVGCLHANPLVLKQSFNRRNLFYEVRPKSANVQSEIIAICKQFHGRTGIVYCNSKRDCEDLASVMKRAGVRADFYHAGMDQSRRSEVQANWQQNKCQVVCATIAFGMGIDKPDVRFVIHMTLPRNIEGFYQETGRAGRDGRPSQCILFYSYRDVSLLQKMIQTDSTMSFQHKEHHRTLLTRVMQYCENKTDCRRKQVLQYFNEGFDPVNCRMQCDNCRDMRGQTVVSHDMTNDARIIVSTMQELAPRLVTTQQCIDVMLGRRTQKTRTCKFDELSEFGRLNKLGATSVERLVHTLISEQVLQEYAQYNHSRYPQTYLKLGPRVTAFVANELRIVLNMASSDSAQPRKRSAGRATFSRSKRRS